MARSSWSSPAPTGRFLPPAAASNSAPRRSSGAVSPGAKFCAT